MQEKTSRQSRQREAVKQTVIEIQAWWIKAEFLCQSSNGFNAKLLKLVNEQKQLSQDHLKLQKKNKQITSAIQHKQRLLMQKSKETFWAVRKECEEYLRTAALESTNSKKKLHEDWQFC